MFLCILVTFVPSFIFSNEHFFLLLLNTTTVEIVEELSRIILLDFCGEVLLRGELEELSTELLVSGHCEWLWPSSTIGVPLFRRLGFFTSLYMSNCLSTLTLPKVFVFVESLQKSKYV